MKSNLPKVIRAVLAILFCFSFQAEAQDWFPLNPTGSIQNSEINRSEWLDKPAGKHGSVLMIKDRFKFEDGTPVKFWGANVPAERAYMQPEEAKVWADFLSGYGFNAVRFHNFTSIGTDGIHSTVITDDKWKNFDFLCNELRKKGIYYGWSNIYGHRVRKADSSRILAYNEIINTKFPWSHLNRTTASLVNFSEDLQALNIELTVNMLNHINPLTGLKYANDPALSYIEFQNEDNIFWGAIEESLKQAPTYRKLLCSKFSKWLLAKYKSQENLQKAWNNVGLNEGELIEKENIYPQPNHGLFSREYELAIKENRPVKQNILDKATFLYEEQVKYYRKFEAAVRKTGYKGPVEGSCWQAGTGLSHLLNLNADYQVGPIDRHNYFGGSSGHNLAPGKLDNSAMISRIGSGLFGTGLQQVTDRPFVFSEWMSLIPNEWTAESAPIIAVYGIGLNGWDGSYVFATFTPNYTNGIQTSWGGIYNACSPTQLALYPALSTMIYRNDIEEGKIAVNRNVSMTEMMEGKTVFRDKIEQDYDRKKIEGAFALQSMAAGRVVISFSGKSGIDSSGFTGLYKNHAVTSNTGQLFWDEKGKGYFTINSPGTKGIVGFARDKTFDLDGIKLKTSNDFAIILVNSLDKGKSISKAKRILITTIARAKNTGMEYNEDHTHLLNSGKAPVLVEPVRFSFSINRKKAPKITVLDHYGNKTSEIVDSRGKDIIFDGALTKSFYYLIEFE